MMLLRMEATHINAVMAVAESVPHAPRWTRSAYEAVLDADASVRRIGWVAEGAGGQVAGFAIAALAPPQAELESIAVAAAFQRQGVARALLTQVMTECSGAGCEELMLEVRASNVAAQALYRAAGFRDAGQRPGYYAFPAEDAIVFIRALEPRSP